MSTFVTVGNCHQPFQRLLDAVAAIAAQLPQPVIVQYGHGRFDAPGCEAHAFISMDEFERLMEHAQLVILHAGAGSIYHAIRVGKIPVVMPRRSAWGEHVDDHQVELSRHLAQSGRVVVAYEIEQLMPAIEKALAMQKAHQKIPREPELVRLVAERLARYSEEL